MTGFLLFSLFIIQIIQRNKMVSTEEILCRIEKGGTLDELAAEFGMRKSVLVAGSWFVRAICAKSNRDMDVKDAR